MIGKTISHYRILGQVGEGGMGVVYVAEDTRLGRRVAIKIPHAGKDESHYRARFLKEARAVSNLNHRNIAAVHDMGETEDGQPYIVMELVSGQTLGDVLAGPGLSVARAVEVIREVADALSEAHSRNIVHRDIKPSNVIINDRGEVKVLDFGLAKQLEEEAGGPNSRTLLSAARTRSDVVIGTPLYLSPEQARGSKVDGRSDLFALGALLYECVAGRPAFSGANVIEIGAQVLHVDPPPPSRFNPRVTAELDRLVMRALAKKPEDRFQKAEEFSAELARVRSRLPDSDSTRTRRLAGVESLTRSSAFITMAETLRRPRFSPLTVIVAAAALAVVALGLYYAFRPKVHAPRPEAIALYESGVEAMREGANFKATGLLDKAVKADDQFALAHARLAEAWSELELLDKAKDEMLVAMTLVRDNGALAREDALYFDAVGATVGRRYAEAVKNYEELVRLRPDLPQRYVDLGRAYIKNDETPKAVEAFTNAAGRDENYAAASLSLGVLHARAANIAGATSAFDRAEKLYAAAGNREGEAEVHYQRGRFFGTLGKKAEAERELQQAFDTAHATGNVYHQVQSLLQLAYLPDDLEKAKALADKALELAQANGMQTLVARGYIDLGAQYLKRNSFDAAESYIKRGVELARDNKMRRIEAVGLVNLASVCEKLDRLDEGVQYAQRAFDYYSQNGFRKEAGSAAQLMARIMGRQENFAGALDVLEKQLKATEPSGDRMMLAQLHRECGSVLSKQDRFVEAVAHFREAVNLARTVQDKQLLAFSLLNYAGALWRLGRYDEAAQSLAEIAEMGQKSEKPDKDMHARTSIMQAYMALSRGRFDEAREKGMQAMAAVREAGGRKDLTAEADGAMCLAEALGGSPARGRQLCDEAARMAADTGDPLFVSNARLALAEVLLESGEFDQARSMALSAEESFARSGRVESDWRALVVAGKACRRAGDETAARQYFARAAAQLSKLEESWGDDAAGYLLRQDVQRLRRELGGDAVAEAR